MLNHGAGSATSRGRFGSVSLSIFGAQPKIVRLLTTLVPDEKWDSTLSTVSAHMLRGSALIPA